MRPDYELSDILYHYGEQFHQKRQVLRSHSKVLRAIQYCRTARFGGHVDRCNECGEERIAYNSCRNRHCPKCQGSNRDRWIADRQKDLLDCKYYHVVFTLPEAVNIFCLHYPRTLYDMLFYSSKDTLMAFGRDEKHLGVEMGAISVLHTLGTKLVSSSPYAHDCTRRRRG